MTSRTSFLSLVIAATLFSGCASREATYSGGHRSFSQVAHIPYFEAQHEIRVLSVDGKRVNSSRADIELAPGRRTIEVIYHPPRTTHSYPVRITFDARAGHSYALSAKVLGGRDAGTGYWEGKYQAFVYDLSPVREVGRSEGPAAPVQKPHRD